MISRRLSGPIFSSSCAAQAGTSAPSFTSRRIEPVDEQRQQREQHYAHRRDGDEPVRAIRSRCCAIFLTSSAASRFGASAVRNIELVTQVEAMATHMT